MIAKSVPARWVSLAHLSMQQLAVACRDIRAAALRIVAKNCDPELSLLPQTALIPEFGCSCFSRRVRARCRQPPSRLACYMIRSMIVLHRSPM
jgi:hypothetical protein